MNAHDYLSFIKCSYFFNYINYTYNKSLTFTAMWASKKITNVTDICAFAVTITQPCSGLIEFQRNCINAISQRIQQRAMSSFCFINITNHLTKPTRTNYLFIGFKLTNIPYINQSISR